MLMSKSLSCLVLLLAAGVIGCDNSESNNAPVTGASGETQKSTATANPATQPIIPVVQMEDWCREHAMPESVCVQCNPSLAATFKQKGDWDAQHNLPKSQCFQCEPSLQEKFAAGYKARYGKEAPAVVPHAD